MKLIWKLLGATALAVGLTPYKVETNEETGEKKYQALLWQATRTNREGEKGSLDINIGLLLPKEEEPHLFSDELCVEYTGAPAAARDMAEEIAKDVEEAVEEVAREVDEAVEEVAREVDEAVEEAAREVDEAVEEVAREVDEAVEEAAREVDEAVEEAAEAAEPKEE